MGALKPLNNSKILNQFKFSNKIKCNKTPTPKETQYIERYGRQQKQTKIYNLYFKFANVENYEYLNK